MISTDGSAVNNGWENATAGIGVWYADGSARNIKLSITGQETKPASNSRAELGAILEALQPVAATLTKNILLWLATFGPKIEMDFVA